MSTCSVPTCSYSFKKGSGTIMHKFPKNGIERKQWLVAIKLDEVNISSKICSYFFPENFYTTSSNGKITLKQSAIPSIFNNHELPIIQQNCIIDNIDSVLQTPKKSLPLRTIENQTDFGQDEHFQSPNRDTFIQADLVLKIWNANV